MIPINGKVVNQSTQAGIPGATIAVNGSAKAAADNQGNFQVSVDSGDDQITISSIGYQAASFNALDLDNAGTVSLTPGNAQTLDPVVVTPAKKNNSGWLLLAGIAVVGMTSKPKKAVSGSGLSNMLPIAALGIGAYLLLKPKAAASPGTGPNAPYTPIYNPGSPGASPGSAAGGILGIFGNIFSGIFGGSSKDPSYVPIGVQPVPGGTYGGSPAANYPTLPGTVAPLPINPGAYTNPDDQAEENYGDAMMFAGIAGTDPNPIFNAGDIVDKTLIAATNVPLYKSPTDSAQPVGTISSGNPIGVVYAYLSPDPTADRAELWWMFVAGPDQQNMADAGGFYFVPHKAGYFNIQALVDQGVLTAAQATAMKNDAGKSLLQTSIEKYAPLVIGGLITVGIVKAVINKAL